MATKGGTSILHRPSLTSRPGFLGSRDRNWSIWFWEAATAWRSVAESQARAKESSASGVYATAYEFMLAPGCAFPGGSLACGFHRKGPHVSRLLPMLGDDCQPVLPYNGGPEQRHGASFRQRTPVSARGQ